MLINGIIQNNDVIHKTPLLKSQNCKIVKLHSHEKKIVKMKLYMYQLLSFSISYKYVSLDAEASFAFLL